MKLVDAKNKYIQDEDGNSVNIGCCNRGIIIFRSNQQQNIFQWTTIMKLAFKKKLFSVYMKDEKVIF